MDTDEMLAQLRVAANLCREHGHLPAEKACNLAADLLSTADKPAKKPKKD